MKMNDRPILRPFRSKGSRSTLPPIPRFIQKKQQRYSLKHVHGPKTWMIDFMEVDEHTSILNLLHCNSRYWIPLLCRNQNEVVVMAALRLLKRTAPNMFDTLISDAAKTFTDSRVVRDTCQALGVKQIVYNMSRGGIQIIPTHRSPTTIQFHNQLSLIDRMSKAVRDMIYNTKRELPTFELTDETLDEIANIYNNTPHETLSKTMGFDVTPANVLANQRLQDEIVRRWMASNYSKTQSFDIELGDIVYLYSPPTVFDPRKNKVEGVPYRVVKCNAGNYLIERIDDEHVQRVVQRHDIVKGCRV